MALTDNLIAHWKLNEASGNTRVDSYNSYDLPELSGGVASATGKIGDAANFVGGSNLYLQRTNLEESFYPETAGEFTVACWFYRGNTFSEGGSCGALLISDGSYLPICVYIQQWSDVYTIYGLIRTSGGSDVYIGIQNGSRLQQWDFVVVRWDGANIEIIRNAEFDNSDTDVAGSIWSWSSFVVTIDLRCGPRSTLDEDVRVDSLSFWHRSLGDAEITQLYNDGNGLDYPFTTGLIEFVLPMFRPA